MDGDKLQGDHSVLRKTEKESKSIFDSINYAESFDNSNAGEGGFPVGIERTMESIKGNYTLPVDERKIILLSAFKKHRGEQNTQAGIFAVVGFML